VIEPRHYKTGAPHYRNPRAQWDTQADEQDFIGTPECRNVQLLLLAYALGLHGRLRPHGSEDFTVAHLPIGWKAEDLHRLKNENVELYGDGT
jgi:hypothetical protein